MRRRLCVVVVAAMLLPAVAACGIPDETEVRVNGSGPQAETGPPARSAEPPRSRTQSSVDPLRFAQDFLTAAAGEPDEAYKRFNDFIVEEKWLTPQPGNEVTLIRLDAPPLVTYNSDGTSSITIERVQQVGVLRANGSIGEPIATESSYTFTVGRMPTDPGEAGGLWVLDPPPVLLMTDEALRYYYQEHTIYFWNVNRDALVPDLRYLPVTVPVQRQATEVLDWLIGGPADWLGTSVVRLPDGTGPLGNVPAPKEGGRLEVNLSVKAGALDTNLELDKLFNQIVWSLKLNPTLYNELELKIQNQSRKIAVAEDWRRDHPLYQLGDPPARYGVLAGTVYPLTEPGEDQTVPIVPEANQDIVAASLSRDGATISAALVTRDGTGVRLRTGAGIGTVRDFRTGKSFTAMTRPVWLKTAGNAGPTGLVVADDGLHEFGTDSAVLRPVQLTGAPGRVTAVGAALDGQRIAFIAGGRLYVAGVRTVDGTLSVGPSRRLATSLRDLTAVDWYGENSLVVAGVEGNGRAAVYKLNVDGAQESAQVTDVGAAVTHLATYPENPDVPALNRPPLYEANQVAYSTGTPIGRDQVVAGAAGLPPGSATPTAPFYLY
ncbi:LpqB family beta-propeller domain-containing protein [Plantactinospora sonchi]|uniref:LpqB family beta-propeller domain-containing protein n=1 Tax=Plantactinospora sonchi TaxID=1544735 RepID=A0ABU7RLB8_9ACTN